MPEITRLADIEQGEPIGARQTEDLIGRIDTALGQMTGYASDVAQYVAKIYAGQGWLSLGYESWEDLARERLGGRLEQLDRVVRQSLVAELYSAGLSVRAIAPVVGINQATVVRDVRVMHDASLAPGGPVVEHVTTEKTHGRDGRMYTRMADTDSLAPRRTARVRTPILRKRAIANNLVVSIDITGAELGALDQSDRDDLAAKARARIAELSALVNAVEGVT